MQREKSRIRPATGCGPNAGGAFSQEVHLSFGIKEPRSHDLRSEPAIIAGLARASLPESETPWADYAGDYGLIRDKLAEAIEGFEDFNRRVRQPLGFRLKQPARELVFLTDTGRANFSAAPLAEVAPAPGRLLLGTMRSHDQWNTTIYSDNDRYRGVKNLRTLVFMNREDMSDRGLEKYDLVDITSFAKDGSKRSVRGYRALPYDLPRESAMGYMPELNVLSLPDRRLQRAERPAPDEAPGGRDHPVGGAGIVICKARRAICAGVVVTEEHQIRLSYSQFVVPTWQVFGLLLRIAKVL